MKVDHLKVQAEILRGLYGNNTTGDLLSSSEDEDSGFEDSDEDVPSVKPKHKASAKMAAVIEEDEDESDIEDDWKALPVYKEAPVVVQVKKPSFRAPPVKKPEVKKVVAPVPV